METRCATCLLRVLVQVLQVAEDHIVDFLGYSSLDGFDDLGARPDRITLATRAGGRGGVARWRGGSCVVGLIGGDGGSARGNRVHWDGEVCAAGVLGDCEWDGWTLVNREGHCRAFRSRYNHAHGGLPGIGGVEGKRAKEK